MQDENMNMNPESEQNFDEKSMNEFHAQVEQLQKELSEAQQRALRLQAEMDNMHKRAERSLSEAHKYAASKLLHDLVPVMDSLVHGLAVENAAVTAETLRHGMQLTMEQLSKVLTRHGVKEIDPKPGDTFDPMLHEAMTMVPNPDFAPNTIIQVLQKGYELHGRVIRAARVIVSK